MSDKPKPDKLLAAIHPVLRIMHQASYSDIKRTLSTVRLKATDLDYTETERALWNGVADLIHKHIVQPSGLNKLGN